MKFELNISGQLTIYCEAAYFALNILVESDQALKTIFDPARSQKDARSMQWSSW